MKTHAKFKNTIIIVAIVLFFALICLLVLCCDLCCDSAKAKVYASPEAILDLFNENKSEFEDIAKIIDDPDFSSYLFSVDKKIITLPHSRKWRQYLSSQKYNQVCEFFKKYKLLELGTAIDCIVFGFKSEECNASILYFRKDVETLERWIVYESQKGEIEKIEENWYILKRDK